MCTVEKSAFFRFISFLQARADDGRRLRTKRKHEKQVGRKTADSFHQRPANSTIRGIKNVFFLFLFFVFLFFL